MKTIVQLPALIVILTLVLTGGSVGQSGGRSGVDVTSESGGALDTPPGFTGISGPSGGRMETVRDGRPRFSPAPSDVQDVAADTAWVEAFGSTLTGTVERMRPFGTDLYVIGNFSTDGGTTWEKIARWDGHAWHSLGFGSTGYVHSVLAYGNDIFVCGDFTSAGGVAANDVARLSGGSWSALGSGTDGVVWDLEVIGTNIYAGGVFATAGGGVGNGIAKWNGSAWSPMGLGFNDGGTVYRLAALGNDLYAGGDFPGASGVASKGIIRWNGSSWVAVSPGMAGGGRIGLHNDMIWAIENIVFWVEQILKNVWEADLYSWDGGAWTSPFARLSLPSAFYPLLIPWFSELASSGEEAYLCGQSHTIDSNGATGYIERWDGDSWIKLGSGVNKMATGVATYDGDLYVAGNFDSAGGKPANGIARWRIAPAPEWAWAKGIRDGGTEEATDIAVDDAGNTIVTGTFDGSIDFGSGPVLSNGPMDIFIAKYDPDGNILWAKTAGGSDGEYANGIAIAPDGGFFIAGSFLSSPMVFDTVSLPKPGADYDAFIARYDRDGNALWARVAGGSDWDFVNAVAADDAGNAIITGQFLSASLQFGTTPPLVNAGGFGYDLFLVSYRPDGTLAWARREGTTGNEMGGKLATDPEGNIYCTGQFTGGPLAFGSTDPFTSSGQEDVFVVKFDTAGIPVWSRSAGGANADEGNEISIVSSGGVCVGGRFISPSISFDTTTLVNSNPGGVLSDIFLTRYSSSGDPLWARRAGGRSYDNVTGMAVDPTGNLYVTGTYASRVFTIGRSTLINPYSPQTDPFIAKYDSNGNSSWVRYTSAMYSDGPAGLGLDPAGNVVIAGTFTSPSVRFYPDSIANPGPGGDVFIVKLGDAPYQSTIEQSVAIGPGWNLVSVPLTVGNFGKDVLFPTAGSPAYAYEEGYIQKTTLENGEGYWLKFPGAKSVAMTGLTRTLDTVDVLEGWNLVGSLSDPVAVTSVGSLPPGIVTTQFFGYDAGYYSSDSIMPGGGYWVKSSQVGRLILSSASAIAPSNRIRIVPTDGEPPPIPAGDGTGSDPSLPTRFALEQNYPNPFNPSTLIRYQLPVDARVRMGIFNILGEEVATLVDEVQRAGYKSVMWTAAGIPSGMYFYRLSAGDFEQARKLVIIK